MLHQPGFYKKLWFAFFITAVTINGIYAQQAFNLTNHWTGENIVLTSGEPSLSKNTDTWIIEKTADDKYVRIKNVATGGYLNTEKGPLATGEAPEGWWSAQWVLVPVGPYMQIINRWRETYINNEHGKLEATPLGAPGWWSAQWTLAPATSLSPVNNGAIAPASKPGDKNADVIMGTTGGSNAFPDPFSAANEYTFYKINIAGELMKTTDGGHNWREAGKKLATVSVTRDGALWGTTYQDETQLSTNGGASWATVGANYTQVSGADSNAAWAVTAEGNILKTTDGGRNWQPVTGAYTSKIAAASKDIAWGINADSVWRTADGGATWALSMKKLKQVSPVNNNTAWAIGSNGELFLTTNGGQTWLTYPGIDVYFNACAALSATNAYVVDKNFKLVKINALDMK